jgi:hypothetical protein
MVRQVQMAQSEQLVLLVQMAVVAAAVTSTMKELRALAVLADLELALVVELVALADLIRQAMATAVVLLEPLVGQAQPPPMPAQAVVVVVVLLAAKNVAMAVLAEMVEVSMEGQPKRLAARPGPGEILEMLVEMVQVARVVLRELRELQVQPAPIQVVSGFLVDKLVLDWMAMVAEAVLVVAAAAANIAHSAMTVLGMVAAAAVLEDKAVPAEQVDAVEVHLTGYISAQTEQMAPSMIQESSLERQAQAATEVLVAPVVQAVPAALELRLALEKSVVVETEEPVDLQELAALVVLDNLDKP